MLFVTGDCHGDFRRFATKAFPIQKELSKRDYVVILGDAGLIWDGSRREQWWLDWLEDKPFTVLDIGGNHENYELLEQYPKIPWHGGVAYQLRPSVLHLCRGYVFDLNGCSVFTLGGAESHDMEVILPRGPKLSGKKQWLDRRQIPYRVYCESWWPQELPNADEYLAAWNTLQQERWSVDLVLTHCAPDLIQRQLAPQYPTNELTGFLQFIKEHMSYEQWLCGHYHQSWYSPADRFQVLYEEIIKIE